MIKMLIDTAVFAVQALSLTFVKTIEENGNDVIKLLFLELLVQFIFDTVLHACSFS